MTEGNAPTFFVGTGAGLYRSMDRQVWTPVELVPFGGTPPAIAQVEHDVRRDRRFWAVSSDPTFRILRSDDDGQTWVLKDQGIAADETVVHVYQVDLPNAPIYAATEDENGRFRVYKSMDAGESWTFLRLVPEGPSRWQRIVIHPKSPELWYYAEARRIFKSTNEGATWTGTGPFPLQELPRPGLQNSVTAMAANPDSQQQLLMATAGPVFGSDEFRNGAFFSDDQGSTWTRVTPDGFQTVVYQDGVALLHRGESNTIWTSGDGGRTFTGPFDLGPPTSFEGFEIDRRDPNTYYIGFGVSDDRGRTWQEVLGTVTPIAGLDEREVMLRGSRQALAPVSGTARLVNYDVLGASIPYTILPPDAPWLTVEPAQGETPETLRVIADTRGLDVGEQRTTVAVTLDGSFNTEARFDVVLDVTNEAAPTLTPVIETYAGTGGFGDSGDGGPALEARLENVGGLDVAPNGDLYIADSFADRVRRVSPDGIIRGFAGSGEEGFAGDGGRATQARMNGPRDVAVRSDGAVFVADRFNRRVRMIERNGQISTYAGDGEFGSNEARGAAADLHVSPGALAAGSDGILFIQGSVYRTVLEGTYSRWSSRSYDGLAVGPSGTLYGARGNVVVAIRSSGDEVPVAGTGEAGYSGDGGPATEARLNDVADVAVDADGRIFIADEDNHVIRMVEDGMISTFAGTGIEGFSGDGGPANLAELDSPESVAIGPDGELYIGDDGNNRVRVVRPASATAPVLTSAGVVSAASFGGGSVAPAQIVSIFGENLANGLFVAETTPLPTTLGGVTLELTDSAGTTRALNLFFVSGGQVNAEIPADAALGAATLRVQKDDGSAGAVGLNVVAAAPGLFAANANGMGVAAAAAVTVDGGGVQTPIAVVNPGPPAVGAPIDVSGDTVVLLLFGTGLRNFSQGVTVTVDGVPVQVLGVAAQPQFVGLDQINVILPPELAGRGEVDVVVTVDGIAANTVTVTIQ